MTDVKEDRVLDCTGLLCPMPVVKTGKEMRTLEPGQILKILATDRGAISDFPAWAEDTGNLLLESGDDNGVLYFYIEKGDEE